MNSPIRARAGPLFAARTVAAVLLVLAAVATSGAVYVIAVSRIAPSPAAQSLVTTLVCLGFVGAGARALLLRPYARFGLLLTAVGFTSLISALHEANHALPYTVGVLASNVVFAVLVHALLAYPSGRLGSRSRRLLVVAAYLDVLVLQAAAVVFDPLTRYHSAHPRNLALVDAHAGVATVLLESEAAIAAGVAVAAVAVLARRVQTASTVARRQQTPVLAGGALALLLFALGLALTPLSSSAGFLGFGLALIASLALPTAFVATLVQGRLSHASVGELLLELRDPHPGDLEEALRRALGDPSLRLGRLAADGGFEDALGVALIVPRPHDAQVVTALLHQGETIGMLVHDRSLRVRAQQLDAVGAAAGFALANERALHATELIEARNRALLDAIPDPILRLDSTNTYTDVTVDDSGAMLLEPREIVGRTVREVVPLDVAEALLACAERARETGEMHAVEYELTYAGIVHYCESRMVPSGNGEVVIIMRDFTEKRRQDAELRRLAAEQAALRRVATLVAGNAPPERVFQTVTEEVCRLLDLRTAVLARFEDDGLVTVVGKFGAPTGALEVGNVVELELGGTAQKVFETGAPARAEYANPVGEAAAELLALGFVASIGVPITVAGDNWGVLVVALREGEILERETEQRLQAFAELVGLAVASADARDELAASRLRIVEASDTERRRLERNLHDGAQQRLVALSVGLRLATTKLRIDPRQSEGLLETLSRDLADALVELRELAQGIHPAVLTERGLGPAIEVLAVRTPVTVELDLDVTDRLPEPVETAAYYTVSEALTNVAKHAGARSATVRVAQTDAILAVEVFDDGAGGADVGRGSGLRGLSDRIQALDGEFSIESPAGRGTLVRAELPVHSRKLAIAGTDL